MNCDFIAPYYRWIEYAGLGGALERRRLRYLNEIAGARRVLVLGEGDGRFLRELVRSNSQARIDCVDRSERMLTLARRAAGEDRVVYHRADAREFEFARGEYDLIVAHFFFDCFSAEELRVLVARFSEAAAPGATWLISEFRIPSSAWLAVAARAFVRGLYVFFRVTTGLKTAALADHRPILEAQGFRLMRASYERRGLLASEIWSH